MAGLWVNTFIGDPCESLLTVEKDIVRCPSLQAPAPAPSSLSKEAQEQQRNDEGGPAIFMLALMDIFFWACVPQVKCEKFLCEKCRKAEMCNISEPSETTPRQ